MSTGALRSLSRVRRQAAAAPEVAELNAELEKTRAKLRATLEELEARRRGGGCGPLARGFLAGLVGGALSFAAIFAEALWR